MIITMDQCRGSGASVGGVQGGMSRGRKAACPVCGRKIGMRPGRAGRLYPHAPPKDRPPSLRLHMLALHPHMKIPRRGADLALAHSEQHYRYNPNHYHDGANLGPGHRPPGWTTGADVVMKDRRRI